MFNIFNVLSVADKELVHSSIIKLLIDEKELNFTKNFLDINAFFGNSKLEDVKKNSIGKSIRLDVVGFDETNENNYVFIIENKFKSTPTTIQLKEYDAINEINGAKKFLLVFSKEQVPSDVLQHCEDNHWTIKSYFNFESSRKDSLLELLQEMPKLEDLKKQYLITEYLEYLLSIKEDLNFLFNNNKMLNSSDIEKYLKENSIQSLKLREVKFRYLIHIQALLSKKITNLVIWKVVTSNDGGSRPVPSVPFWKGNFMYTIDGDSLKIGFSYNHSRAEIAEQLKNVLLKKINDSGIINTFGGKQIKNTIKNDKISSVISLVSYDIKNWYDKPQFIEDATVIFNAYYKIFHEQQNLITQL
ncbi:hypothetical protein FBBAL38_11039 [Flavobacteria bacterium BAL38]|nr:hypothetical protein FBBAL38_11039 [Flavobacteria bacterium BAL38]